MRKKAVSIAEALEENKADFMMERGSHYASSSRMSAEEFADIIKEKSVVDLGCGDGAAEETFLDLGIAVLGVDVNEVKCAANPADTICEDVLSWLSQQPESSVPNIYSHHFLEHVPNPEEILTEIARVLQPGGYCMLVVPAGDSLVNPVHYIGFDSVEELVPDGLTMVYGKEVEFNQSLWVVSRKL